MVDIQTRREIEEVRMVIAPNFLLTEKKWQSPDKKFKIFNKVPSSYKRGILVEVRETGEGKIITLSPLNRLVKDKKALLIVPFANGSVEWRYRWIRLDQGI